MSQQPAIVLCVGSHKLLFSSWVPSKDSCPVLNFCKPYALWAEVLAKLFNYGRHLRAAAEQDRGTLFLALP
ncbi:hypothetical protein O6P43_014363 [Quillaja saponaria]|uniref:Uncharacterized protein n=1 Tax=Quillaja saponaria TaxID=32244 RepID=A0AAD7LUK9_QUISA|nr:hypothetical protein O6P43_014363 [Quillaja saponaria]